jgi:tRNA nucleotidyltransferase (CCA-adding enzyme)
MSKNLEDKLRGYLPRTTLKFINTASETGCHLGYKLYLAGGIVRDLLLERPNFDLDLVVEGDAIKLAHILTDETRGKLTVHPRFNTANIIYHNFNVDVATARSETYSHPGALPSVQHGNLVDDLIRRDFSINAMAINLVPDHFGQLIDPHGGKEDIQNKKIRILHSNSFIDDATRILRGIRYEQRLKFSLEKETEKTLRRDISMLDTISHDRLRHELYHILMKEPEPERVFARAEQLGVLSKLHHQLKGNGWLSQKFAKTRTTFRRISPPTIYFCLLVYSFKESEVNSFNARFNLPKSLAQAMLHTVQIRDRLDKQSGEQLRSSEIYHMLNTYNTQAIRANLVATDSPTTKKNLKLYLDKLLYVKPILTGDDLLAMGISSGPELGELLQALHDAKINGELETREQETEFAHSYKPDQPNHNL